ncbi:MAG: GNAT family N-acetyltransferase [Clostridia bacterium]|nr:GNAT family N-acetyltransferase [Clostridia bacterium]
MMRIIKAEKTDIEPLAAILAEGFTHDPLYCHYIPYEQERQGILLQIFRKYLTDFWEELTVYTTPERAGVLCICPSYAKGEERVILPTHVQKVYDRINEVVAPLFYEEYLVLDLLAVRADLRGKGLARALVEEFRREVARRRMVGIVEIYEPNHVAFYEKLGFHLAHLHPVGETLSAYLMEI